MARYPGVVLVASAAFKAAPLRVHPPDKLTAHLPPPGPVIQLG
jgi:hypothetical protein